MVAEEPQLLGGILNENNNSRDLKINKSLFISELSELVLYQFSRGEWRVESEL